MINDSNKWPPVEGRYNTGNKNSPVAVCTNRSIDEIKIDPQKVAIWGKCVTENIGIEKIIQNIVSNPNIRYLVLCGKASKGHFISQTIEVLVKNGVDKDKRIIGSKGNMPYLRNIDEKLIERFRKQIIPVNIVGETDDKKIAKIIDKLLKTKPEEFKAEALKIAQIKEIEAQASIEWISDPNGFFVISVDKNRNKIIVEHFQNNKLKNKIVGDSAEEICKTIVHLDLIGDFDQKLKHAMYLGRELQKAEIALNNNLNYEQDSSMVGENNFKKEKGRDDYEWHD